MTDRDDLIDAIRERASAPLSELRGLPPASYTSDELFSLECDRIFMREWLCVGRLDQVPTAGDFRCLDVIGEPLVMVHGDDGFVRVLSRVCRHRAMDVARGSGHTERFACPYHGWTYNLDGRLAGAPHMSESSGFERSAIRLHEFRTETWAGFVFVNLDGQAEPLGPRLSRLTERLARFPLDSLVTVREKRFDCDWNWKLMVENFVECYHHLGSHRESVEPWFPAREAQTEAPDPSFVLTRVAANYENFDDGEERLPLLVDPPEDAILILALFPTHLVVIGLESMWWMQVLPQALERFELVVAHSIRAHAAADPSKDALIGEYFDEFLAVNDEDIEVCRGVQRGARSRFATPGPLSALEEPLQRFFDYLARRFDD